MIPPEKQGNVHAYLMNICDRMLYTNANWQIMEHKGVLWFTDKNSNLVAFIPPHLL